ncbi:MAG: hypothetical protein DRO09_01715 [Thermoprotei archaeon]|nr:MAG: hypothetical protein DRO09_01715 [Thermoprotei archaeon]
MPLEEALRRFQEGVRGAGPKWESRTIAATQWWRQNVEPFYTAAIACSQATRGLGGYDRLIQYANCMKSRIGRGGGVAAPV